MRKRTYILSLVAVLLLVTASDVFAQRVRVGVGGRGGVAVGVGAPYYGSSYYGGRGFYGSPYYFGSRYNYMPAYYTTPGYYYSNYVTQAPPPEVRQAFYADPNVATITVLLPNADAQVWFDDTATIQRGKERSFSTPALQQGGIYTIKAGWTEDGRPVEQQRQVQVQPGQSVTVNFRTSPPESLPAPLPKK